MNPTLSMTALALALSTPAVAKTPDGLTPSVETVCDDYSGAAFGLCNAYCEAMDCDSEFTKASEKACDKVAANFEKKTGEVLVCEAVPECTVTAKHDIITLYEPGTFSIAPLENDTVVPDDASLEIVSDTAPSALTYEDNLYKGEWNSDVSSTYYATFEYTACCNDSDSCDTATVTISGS